ncbi:hypothetical protein VTH82DRAFT_1041 [Thermothelomyces myriococcoides]
MDTSSLLALPTSPATSGLQIFALSINFVFPALALLVISVRVAGRLAARLFGIDDCLVCIAMLMSLAQTVISFFFIKTNFIGIEPEEVPPHDPTQGLIWAYAVQILYSPILALVKSSVLVFLIRLFGQRRWVRRFFVCFNAANLSQMVGVFFAIIFQCIPISRNWDFTITDGYCVDRRVLYLFTAAFNIVVDILILGLPLWVFSSLKIPKRAKTALLIVFLLGFLVTITSIIRLLLVIQGIFNTPIFPDSDANVGFISSAIETNLALITASAPALRPIFRSRSRGGWFARSVMATVRAPGDDSESTITTFTTTHTSPDLELGQESVGWNKAISPISSSDGGSRLGAGATRFGRGGSRGGRKSSTSRGGQARTRKSGSKNIAAIKSIGTSRATTGSRGWRGRTTNSSVATAATTTHPSSFFSFSSSKRKHTGKSKNKNKVRPAITLVRTEPESTEQQPQGRSTMNDSDSVDATRVSDIQREIDGIVREIAVARTGRTGTYAGTKPPTPTSNEQQLNRHQQQRKQQREGENKEDIVTIFLRQPRIPRTSRTPASAMTAPRPSMEAAVPVSTPLPPPRPSTSGSASGRRVAWSGQEEDDGYSYGYGYGYGRGGGDTADNMYYYDYADGRRLSGYSDRRLGFVTPRGMTPTSRGCEGSGRPF